VQRRREKPHQSAGHNGHALRRGGAKVVLRVLSGAVNHTGARVPRNVQGGCYQQVWNAFGEVRQPI